MFIVHTNYYFNNLKKNDKYLDLHYILLSIYF